MKLQSRDDEPCRDGIKLQISKLGHGNLCTLCKIKRVGVGYSNAEARALTHFKIGREYGREESAFCSVIPLVNGLNVTGYAPKCHPHPHHFLCIFFYKIPLYVYF